ncbi:hypothetical protein FOCC_FOCC000867 [Frankliniella occidentalis]|nr:hypothetical protein FOCC_FOCC000867 [Frankliniella occidentalis]
MKRMRHEARRVGDVLLSCFSSCRVESDSPSRGMVEALEADYANQVGADTWSTSAGSVASDLDDDAVVATTAGALRGVAVEGSSDVHIGGTHTHVHAAPGSQVTLALTASNPPALTATGRQGRQPPAAAGQDGVIANPPLPATVQDLRPPTAALQETTAQDQCPPVELEGIVVQGQQPPAVPQATVQHQYQHEGGLVARAMWRALTWREAYWKLHFGFFLCKIELCSGAPRTAMIAAIGCVIRLVAVVLSIVIGSVTHTPESSSDEGK